jgi:hypothetical protein
MGRTAMGIRVSRALRTAVLIVIRSLAEVPRASEDARIDRG